MYKLTINYRNRAEIGIMLKLRNSIKPKENALSGFKLMSRDRVPYIYYEIHPHAATRDFK